MTAGPRLGSGACGACLQRTWLLGRLAGRIEIERARLLELLQAGDDELVVAVAAGGDPELHRERREFDPCGARTRAEREGLELICRCDPRYPVALLRLAAPPAVLHVAGGLDRLARISVTEPVAVVGARAPSSYGREVARALAGGLAGAGLSTVSGLARGIDTAAHEGALAAGGMTIAVLPGNAAQPYPATGRQLHRTILQRGLAISEFGPGTPVRRWSFKARNRLIAALSAVTVVVEGTTGSGSLVTARLAEEAGRTVGAVPGRVTSETAAGPNQLLAEGALVVRDVQDVLDHVFGKGVRTAPSRQRPALTASQRALVDAVAGGCGPAAAAVSAGLGPAEALAALAELELGGWLRRGHGGSVEVIP